MRDIVPILGVMIPIFALLIPIVALLTQHQRKMAELIHARPPLPNPELDQLRQEVQELKMLLHQQTIALDNLTGRAAPADPVRERVGGTP